MRPFGVVTIRCFHKRDRYFDLPFYVHLTWRKKEH